MFNNCKNLTQVDISGFDTSSITLIDAMFNGCSNLAKIEVPCGLTLDVSLPASGRWHWYMADGTIVTQLPKDLNESTVLTRKLYGSYGDIVWSVDSDGLLIVEGTGEFSSSVTNNRAPWYDFRDLIKSAKIDLAEITDLSYMFSDCSNLTNLDFSNFDTRRYNPCGRVYAETW